MKKVTGLLAVVVLILCVGCAKRPVVSADPDFRGKDVRKGPSAFLLPDRIDIKPVVQSFVTAFDGNPAQAIPFVRSSLVHCLTGKETLRSEYPPVRLKLQDLETLVDTALVRELIVWKSDEYGIAHPEVPQPEQLNQVLEDAQIEYLLLFHNVRFDTAVSERPTGLMTSATVSGIEMSAQAVIWDRKLGRFTWNSFVNGGQAGGRSFSRRDTGFVVRAFCYDLFQGLR